MLLASANTLLNKNDFATATLSSVVANNTNAELIVGSLLAIEGELITCVSFSYVGNLETTDLVIAVPL